MLVTVVLNYNDFQSTSRFINDIRKYDVINKIIVVDNCSTDDSFKQLEMLCDEKIDLISTNCNGGYAKGNNLGIKYAEEMYHPEYVMVANPDILVSECTILNLIKYLASHEKVALVSGLMCDKNGNVMKNFALKLPNYIDILRSCSIVTLVFSEIIFKSSPLYNLKKINKYEGLNVGVVPGSFFIIKDKYIQEVNYFEEKTFLYCEEYILSYKLKSRNLEVHILPTEKYIHYHSVTIDKSIKSWIKKQKINENSHIVFMRDYLKISSFKITLYRIINRIGIYSNFVISKLFKRI